MKVAVSNIAWDPMELTEHLHLLAELGCEGVELAPSVIWREPVDATQDERRAVRRMVESRGLTVVALHALFYTRPDLHIFEGYEDARAYLVKLVELAGDLGAGRVVFGSPKARSRGHRDRDECIARAATFFRECAGAAERRDVVVCVEPLSEADGCDFITNSREGLELVARVDHPHFRLHLDVKAMIGADEDFDDAFARSRPVLEHVHVGDPGLAPPGTSGYDHTRPGDALRNSGYDRFVSIEMRRGFGPSREMIRRSVDYVRRCYLGAYR
jgi:sugar phosphate isomerase/epimerase